MTSNQNEVQKYSSCKRCFKLKLRNTNRTLDNFIKIIIDNKWISIFLYFLTILLIYMSSTIWNFEIIHIKKESAEILGVFGDFVGGTVNTFLTFFALIFIAKSYKTQQEEIKILRNQEKTDLTFRMVDMWNSLSISYDGKAIALEETNSILKIYQKYKNEASGTPKNNIRNINQEKIELILCKANPISIFFQDTIIFCNVNKIDKELFIAIFQKRFNDYYQFINDMDKEIKDNSFKWDIEEWKDGLEKQKNILENDMNEIMKITDTSK